MINFVVYETATGNLVKSGTCPVDMLELQAGDGQSAIPIPAEVSDPESYSWIDGEPEILPPVIPTLAELKAAKWETVRIMRESHIGGGCSTPSGVMDTTLVSRTNISGAVQMASLAMAASQAFEIDWTIADNSTVTLDGLAMIAVGIAVGAHVAACHAVARALRVEIEAAEDVEELEAIDPEGAAWPG